MTSTTERMPALTPYDSLFSELARHVYGKPLDVLKFQLARTSNATTYHVKVTFEHLWGPILTDPLTRDHRAIRILALKVRDEYIHPDFYLHTIQVIPPGQPERVQFDVNFSDPVPCDHCGVETCLWAFHRIHETIVCWKCRQNTLLQALDPHLPKVLIDLIFTLC